MFLHVYAVYNVDCLIGPCPSFSRGPLTFCQAITVNKKCILSDLPGISKD